MMRVI